ncbi:MAG: cytochrome d ubiquinol oxidase subunit II [Ignavibacteria bacterium]
MIDLNTIWFLLIGVLIIGYAILDGFDLGVGVIQLFTRDAKERKVNINAVGPVWDGNEVWLLTGGGALFAAFPIVYATVFSGFYLAFMLLLFFLIFRAGSFEFRKFSETPEAKKRWDLAFALGSIVPALLYGVAIGNIMKGLPIEIVDGKIVSHITFLGLLNPYAILIGLTGFAMFVMQGATYMTMKTEGSHLEKMIKWANGSYIAFISLYVISTIITLFVAPYLFEGIMKNILFWILFLLLLAGIVYYPVALKSKKFGLSFLTSSVMIATLIGLLALSLYPRLVPSSIDLTNFSLTIYNSSSSQYTLKTMLIIALIGMPIVIAYTIFIYRVFRGKVVLTKDSY